MGRDSVKYDRDAVWWGGWGGRGVGGRGVGGGHRGGTGKVAVTTDRTEGGRTGGMGAVTCAHGPKRGGQERGRAPMHLMTGSDQTECIRPFELAHGEKAPNRACIGEKMGCYLNCDRIFGVLLERLNAISKKWSSRELHPSRKSNLQPFTTRRAPGGDQATGRALVDPSLQEDLPTRLLAAPCCLPSKIMLNTCILYKNHFSDLRVAATCSGR